MIGMAVEWMPRTKQYANTIASERIAISWTSPVPMSWMPCYDAKDQP